MKFFQIVGAGALLFLAYPKQAAIAGCTLNSQCTDLNFCTNDVCINPGAFGTCAHSPVTDGTLCTLAGYPNATCLAGSCSSTEFCADFLDNDGDGYTDERSPTTSGSCRGPRGVHELNDWIKHKPASGPTSLGNVGDYCNWFDDCLSLRCVNAPGELGMCTPVSDDYDCHDHYGLPISWSHGAYIGCDDNASLCLPPFPWTDPRAGAANNLLGELCVFNEDCASTWCARSQTTGRCASVKTGKPPCPTGTYYAEVYREGNSTSLCIPNAIVDYGCTTADSCTWVTDHWTCP